jgi:hypothetical protein
MVAMKNLILAASALLLSACIPTYSLVKPAPAAVGDGSMTVTPTSSWNSVPMLGAQAWEEAWTLNGPMLESVAFVTGVPDGKSLVKQPKKADAQVAVFRANMTPNDLVSMVESSYRVGGIAVFKVDSVDPASFLGGTGLKLRYSYAPTDGIGKKGACVLRVVENKLYLMKLDGVTSHYFDAALPEFDAMVASARLGK